jgi:hypothetical protein
LLLERRDFEHVHPVDPTRLSRWSAPKASFAVLEEPQREEMLGRVRDLWNRHPAPWSGFARLDDVHTETCRVRFV